MSAPVLDYEESQDNPEWGSFIDPDDIQDATFVNPEAKSTDSTFVEEEKESPRAKKYRLKVRHGINFLITGLVQTPNGAPDAAALIYHGPAVSTAIGQLADEDAKVRRVIDFITDDTIDNPWLNASVIMVPLIVQMMRNHESAVEQLPGKFKIRIPFTKRYLRVPVKFKFTLSWAKNISYEPQYLTANVLGNPDVQENLAKRGIKIAWPNPTANGYHAR